MFTLHYIVFTLLHLLCALQEAAAAEQGLRVAVEKQQSLERQKEEVQKALKAHRQVLDGRMIEARFFQNQVGRKQAG